MMQPWKLRHISKGVLTYLPLVNSIRAARSATGGTDSSRYCYGVWLRHVVFLARYGISAKMAAVGELGPGDSIGLGIAALLSGASRYVGLDVVPYSEKADLPKLLDEIVSLYASAEPIPDHHEFPAVRPRLASYEFPRHLVSVDDLAVKAAAIREAIRAGLRAGGVAEYRAPWSSVNDVEAGSLDLIVSQGVLQCVDDLPATYRAMFTWLKPGGHCSHAIGFRAMYLSPFWNGLWAYSDLEWRLVRGGRKYLLNRAPLSVHLAHARSAGFVVVGVEATRDDGGLGRKELASGFRHLSADDLRTSGAMVVLRKPPAFG